MTDPRARPRVLAIVGRVMVFAALWLILTGGDLSGLPLAVLAVFATTVVSLSMMPPRSVSWRPVGLAGFVAFFVRESIRGGLDVARRALDPRMPIDPGFVDYRMRVPEGGVRVLFVCCVSLLPGTLSARLQGDHLRIHVLFRPAPAESTIRKLETHIADAFGVELSR